MFPATPAKRCEVAEACGGYFIRTVGRMVLLNCGAVSKKEEWRTRAEFMPEKIGKIRDRRRPSPTGARSPRFSFFQHAAPVLSKSRFFASLFFTYFDETAAASRLNIWKSEGRSGAKAGDNRLPRERRIAARMRFTGSSEPPFVHSGRWLAECSRFSEIVETRGR